MRLNGSVSEVSQWYANAIQSGELSDNLTAFSFIDQCSACVPNIKSILSIKGVLQTALQRHAGSCNLL